MKFDSQTISKLTAQKKASYAKNRHENMDFVEFACHALAENIKSKPIRYRGYGMYWWALKELLIKYGYDFGIAGFGSSDDKDMANRYRMATDEETIVAADTFWYEMVRTNVRGNRDYRLENGELYSLYDDDMEQLI